MSVVDLPKIYEEIIGTKVNGDEPRFVSFRKHYGLIDKTLDKFAQRIKGFLDGKIYVTREMEETIQEFFKETKVFKQETGTYRLYKIFLDSPVNQVAELAKIIDEPVELLTSLLEDTKKHYKVFFIWKDEAHTKKRWIEAPDAELKRVQRKILCNILYKFAPTRFAHGFVHGKSIATNARNHTGKKFVLKLDLKNFFPSIKRDMLMSSFSGLINEDNMKFIFPALELCLLDGRLPQGAPTSPALSNLFCINLDLLFYGLSESNDMIYTRYADDMIFSSNSDKIYRMIPIIKRLVSKFGLVINERKVKVLKSHQRQTVTGLVVNKDGQVSVRKKKRMNLRAYIHHIITGKIPIDHVNFAKLKGHINLINMANPNQGRYFLEKYEEIKSMR